MSDGSKPWDVDRLMMVGSKALDGAADRIGADLPDPAPLANGVVVTAAQCRTAARIIRDADPSVITSASGGARVTLNEPVERPAYIDAGRQDDPKVLCLDVGILPTETYRIDRKGTILDAS